MQWHDVVGSAGAAIILVSYLFLQLQRISSTGLGYSTLNAAGAVMILVSLLPKGGRQAGHQQRLARRFYAV
jgi:hypothetical protein